MEVSVVGAGPAGCATGAKAAEIGGRVRIYEEHKVFGEPVACSGIISRKGLDAMGVPYEGITHNRLKGAVIHLPDGNVLKVKAKKEMANVFDRAKYDELCAEKAQKAGAEIVMGTRPKVKELKGGIIGADGVSSDVAREFGFPAITEFAFCYQEDVDGANFSDLESVHVFVSNEILPGFFAWAIPLGRGIGRVGCGVRIGNNPKDAIDRLVKKEKVLQEIMDGTEIVSRLGGVIPMRIREKTVKGRVMLVGDAAGQAKATTGGGIYSGSMCGRIAGEVAAKAGSEVELEKYEEEWRALYERDLKLHHAIRNLASSMSDGQLSNYLGLAKRLGVEKFLSANGDMDSPSSMMGKLDMSSALGRAYAGLSTVLQI